MIRACSLLLLTAGSVSAATAPCGAPEPPALRVQIGAAPAIAQLRPGSGPQQLQLLLPGGSTPLWSAGPGPAASQHLFDVAARFAGSLVAIDTDSDGLHDRIYAGDLAGRLWRIELANGEPAASFARATILADLGDSTGTRSLLAPADVWLTGSASGNVLAIAIGTAGPGNGNRFHLLHDAIPADAAGGTSTLPAANNYHLDLGSRQSLVASITVHGRTTLAVARQFDPASCMANVAVTTVETAVAATGPVTTEPVWEELGAQPAHAGFEISVQDAGASLRCRLAGHAIEACSTPVPVNTRFWRREDAD